MNSSSLPFWHNSFSLVLCVINQVWVKRNIQITQCLQLLCLLPNKVPWCCSELTSCLMTWTWTWKQLQGQSVNLTEEVFVHIRTFIKMCEEWSIMKVHWCSDHTVAWSSQSSRRSCKYKMSCCDVFWAGMIQHVHIKVLIHILLQTLSHHSHKVPSSGSQGSKSAVDWIQYLGGCWNTTPTNDKNCTEISEIFNEETKITGTNRSCDFVTKF